MKKGILLITLVVFFKNAYNQYDPSLNYDADVLTNADEDYYGTDPYHHDTDGDGVNDCVEIRIGTDPLVAEDSDGDGLYDDFKSWIIHAAVNDNDPSTDHITALADVRPEEDFDNDDRTNAQEQEWGTNPTFAEPNILFIFPEDMGYYTGERTVQELNTLISGLNTPNIDQLASGSVNFTRTFCAQAVCSPSKAGIYSGLVPHSNYIWRNTHESHPTFGGASSYIPLPNPLLLIVLNL